MDTVSKIKQKLDIVDVIGGYLNIKKAGKNYKGLCPFHNEDTPSFMVSPEIQTFKCFGCGEGGDMFTFVEKIEGVEFTKALEILADKAGVEIEKNFIDPNAAKKKKIYEINSLTAKFYSHLLLTHTVGKRALDYVTKIRKLKPATLKEFNLGFAPDTWDTLFQFLTKKGYAPEDLIAAGVVTKKREGNGYIDKFRGRIIFPFVDIDGKTIGFNGRDIVGRDPKYLNTSDTLIFDKSAFLYGLNLAKVEIKKSGAIFVEGQIDVLTSFQNGVKNVIASSGTALSSSHLKMISRYTSELVFCFDPDSAGINATIRALDLANAQNLEVRVVIIPTEYSDLDDFLNKNFSDAKKALENPVPIYDFYFASAMKKYDKDTAYGKKKIVEELSVPYSRIKDSVVFDHYIKKVAGEINADEGALREAIKDKSKLEKTQIFDKKEDIEQFKLENSQQYLLALVLRLDLDTMGSILYKVKSQDFTNEQIQKIFAGIKKYIDSSPKEFEIKYLIDSFETAEEKELVANSYLIDVLETDTDKIKKEINVLLDRIQKAAAKRELAKVSEQIKLAEVEKDTKELQKLTEKFTKISKKLL